MYNTKEDKQLHSAIIIALFLLVVAIVCVKYTDAKHASSISNLDGTETEINSNGNGNSVYQVRCVAQRISDTVEVEWNGNVYSAYVTSESKIQTGDFVTAVFEVGKNGTEFVGIK